MSVGRWLKSKRAENWRRAIAAFKEALTVFSAHDLPDQRSAVSRKLDAQSRLCRSAE
jgi:hypothetical protein